MNDKTKKKYVMVVDEGTSSTRCLIFDWKFNVVAKSSRELNIFMDSDLVEQDGEEIFKKSVEVCKEAMINAGIRSEEILCMGITNQRSTSMTWDKSSGKPLCRAITWMDSRTDKIIKQIKKDGWMDKILKVMMVPQNAPLLDLCWLIRNVELIKEKVKRNEVMFGGMDSWLIFKFTGGKKYLTSFSNVSMYGGFNFLEMKWYEEYLDYLGIPLYILPDVVDDSGIMGFVDKDIFGCEIPISGAIADQQSASFAHRIIGKGMVKCTFGTGGFVDINVGDKFLQAPEGLFSIATYKIKDYKAFQIEGVIVSAGSVMKWMRDSLGLLDNFKEIKTFADSVNDSNGVFFIPSLTGLGAPYWEANANGTMIGFSQATKKAHIIRAALEGIIFRVREICETVVKKYDMGINIINVDGGLCKDDFFCQMVADITGAKIKRPKLIEITGLGAAELAGLAMGIWDKNDIDKAISDYTEFIPQAPLKKKMDNSYKRWKEVLEMSRGWYKEQVQRN